MKLDLQGGELLALDGAGLFFDFEQTNNETVFIVETNLFSNMIASKNTFAENINYFKERNFVLNDVISNMQRILDDATM